MPGAQHAIEYHVVTRGSCWISLVGDVESEPVRLSSLHQRAVFRPNGLTFLRQHGAQHLDGSGANEA
jgi:hypothetical protein